MWDAICDDVNTDWYRLWADFDAALPSVANFFTHAKCWRNLMSTYYYDVGDPDPQSDSA